MQGAAITVTTIDPFVGVRDGLKSQRPIFILSRLVLVRARGRLSRRAI